MIIHALNNAALGVSNIDSQAWGVTTPLQMSLPAKDESYWNYHDAIHMIRHKIYTWPSFNEPN